jgi:hypothetical protein
MKAPYEPPRITLLVTNNIDAIDDPGTRAAVRAIEKVNCKRTLQLSADRVAHFRGRIAALNLSWDDVVIVLVNVDDTHGRLFADVLMPGHDWQPYRDRGEVPFARGLAPRKATEMGIGIFDAEAAAKLHGIREVAVVVIDHGVAEAFAAGDL